MVLGIQTSCNLLGGKDFAEKYTAEGWGRMPPQTILLLYYFGTIRRKTIIPIRTASFIIAFHHSVCLYMRSIIFARLRLDKTITAERNKHTKTEKLSCSCFCSPFLTEESRWLHFTEILLCYLWCILQRYQYPKWDVVKLKARKSQ
jgi:hypothetical protein